MRWCAAISIALFAFFGDGRAAISAPRIERDIPYALTAGNVGARHRQSFDLYLPDAVKAPPLVVFVHGGFWVESDDEYGIGKRIAETLVGDGAAVALVRYRLSPAVRHPVHVRDVAAALAALGRLAGRYGYDTRRTYVIGHSAGATIAAQLALDPAYLKDVGMAPSDLAGVVLISGIYDLGSTGPMNSRFAPFADAAFGGDPKVRRAASPIAHARRGPPLLVLCGERDFKGLAVDARHFVRTLRAAGHAEVRDAIIPGRDHFGIVDLANARLVHALIDDFTGLRPLPESAATLLTLRQRWAQPPYSSEPFAHTGVSVHTYPVNERFVEALRQIFEYNAYELSAYPLKSFRAIDLLAYLDTQSRARIGHGDFLTITDVRGERLYLRRSDIAAYKPVIVIGLDDERNLFRLCVFYRNRLEYSWKPQVPPIMARPLGAFLYFLEKPPDGQRPQTRAGFALTSDSFHLAETDPLAAIVDVPTAAREVLVHHNSCLSCHSFRGVGAHAGHITAAAGKSHGGFALPLESYPPDVWRQFVFDPTASARAIGVRPNPIEGPAAQQLYDSVVAERKHARALR